MSGKFADVGSVRAYSVLNHGAPFAFHQRKYCTQRHGKHQDYHQNFYGGNALLGIMITSSIISIFVLLNYFK